VADSEPPTSTRAADADVRPPTPTAADVEDSGSRKQTKPADGDAQTSERPSREARQQDDAGPGHPEPVTEAPTTPETPPSAPPTTSGPAGKQKPEEEKKEKKKSTRRAKGPLLLLAVLAGLAVASIIGGLAFPNKAIGQACAIGFVPALSITIGVAATHWYSKQGLDQQLASATQNAVYTTLLLQRSVRFIDDRLSTAWEHLENGDSLKALIEVVQAKTAAGLSGATAKQSSRQWESVSVSGAHAAQAVFTEDDDDEDNWSRPRIKRGNNPKVADTQADTAHGAEQND
jgi:hypothetical protein